MKKKKKIATNKVILQISLKTNHLLLKMKTNKILASKKIKMLKMKALKMK